MTVLNQGTDVFWLVVWSPSVTGRWALTVHHSEKSHFRIILCLQSSCPFSLPPIMTLFSISSVSLISMLLKSIGHLFGFVRRLCMTTVRLCIFAKGRGEKQEKGKRQRERLPVLPVHGHVHTGTCSHTLRERSCSVDFIQCEFRLNKRIVLANK